MGNNAHPGNHKKFDASPKFMAAARSALSDAFHKGAHMPSFSFEATNKKGTKIEGGHLDLSAVRAQYRDQGLSKSAAAAKTAAIRGAFKTKVGRTPKDNSKPKPSDTTGGTVPPPGGSTTTPPTTPPATPGTTPPSGSTGRNTRSRNRGY